MNPRLKKKYLKISQELSNFGIKLLSPDLAKSKMDFSIEGKNIRFGLNSIKGVSEKSLKSLKRF
jgi:DNA polymerase III alpha subunit